MKYLLLVAMLFGFSFSAYAIEDKKMAERIANDVGLPAEQVEMVLESFKSEVISTLKNDGEIRMNGIGKFFLQHTDAAERIDPRSGEPLFVPAKNYLRFRASAAGNANFNLVE